MSVLGSKSVLAHRPASLQPFAGPGPVGRLATNAPDDLSQSPLGAWIALVVG